MTAKTQQTAQKFGTEKDVHRLTGLGLKKLRIDRMFRRGLPYYKLGTRVLYDLDEVERLIRAGRQG
ncbi:MAG: hypothetical protein IT168_05910 [Bryobacterales bacterium]|nr:hypothetical protein [Bryobacterales bacterium]